MSTYREEALERFPEFNQEISESENPMALWIELHLIFENAYKTPRNDDLIKRIYMFADWCLQQPQSQHAEDDLFTAACVCFFEHISEYKAAREDMPRWFTVEKLTALESVFRYHLSEEKFAALKKYIAANQHMNLLHGADTQK